MALSVTIGFVSQSSWTDVPDGAITYTISGGVAPYTVQLLSGNFTTIQTAVNSGSGSFSGLYSIQPNSQYIGIYYIAASDSNGDVTDFPTIYGTYQPISCSPVSPTLTTVIPPNCSDASLDVSYQMDTTSTGHIIDVHLVEWDGNEGSVLNQIDDNTTFSTPQVYNFNTNITNPNVGFYYRVYGIDTVSGHIIYGNSGFPSYNLTNQFSPVTFRYNINGPTDCAQSATIDVFNILGGSTTPQSYSVSIDGGLSWVPVANPTVGVTIGVNPGDSGSIIVRCGTGCFSTAEAYTVPTIDPITFDLTIKDATTCVGTSKVTVSNMNGGPGLPFYVSFDNGLTYVGVPDPVVGVFQNFSVGYSNNIIVKSGNCTTTPQPFTGSGPSVGQAQIIGPKLQCLFKTYTLEADMIGGTPPFTYLWGNGATTQSINVTSNVLGTVNYEVTITEAGGCFSQASIGIINSVCGDTYTGTFQGGPYTQTAEMNCLTEDQVSHIYETAINVCGCEDCSDNTKDTIN